MFYRKKTPQSHQKGETAGGSGAASLGKIWQMSPRPGCQNRDEDRGELQETRGDDSVPVVKAVNLAWKVIGHWHRALREGNYTIKDRSEEDGCDSCEGFEAAEAEMGRPIRRSLSCCLDGLLLHLPSHAHSVPFSSLKPFSCVSP